jgi:hypothetical protein
MEYEIDELADAWTDEDLIECGANHMPGWFRDSAGRGQTGEWIPEEAPLPNARELERVG